MASSTDNKIVHTEAAGSGPEGYFSFPEGIDFSTLLNASHHSTSLERVVERQMAWACYPHLLFLFTVEAHCHQIHPWLLELKCFRAILSVIMNRGKFFSSLSMYKLCNVFSSWNPHNLSATIVYMGKRDGGSDDKASVCNAGDPG